MPCSISGSPWKTFFEAHWDTLAALDFFNIDVLTFAGIFRYHVLFVIRLKTREVQIVGITAQPCEKWMKQIATATSILNAPPINQFLVNRAEEKTRDLIKEGILPPTKETR